MMKMTKYYYFETSADRGVLCTDGKEFYICCSDGGRDVLTGVDLYGGDAEDVIERLKRAYENFKSTLYSFEECKNEFVTPPYVFNENDFEKLEEILEKA